MSLRVEIFRAEKVIYKKPGPRMSCWKCSGALEPAPTLPSSLLRAGREVAPGVRCADITTLVGWVIAGCVFSMARNPKQKE